LQASLAANPRALSWQALYPAVAARGLPAQGLDSVGGVARGGGPQMARGAPPGSGWACTPERPLGHRWCLRKGACAAYWHYLAKPRKALWHALSAGVARAMEIMGTECGRCPCLRRFSAERVSRGPWWRAAAPGPKPAELRSCFVRRLRSADRVLTMSATLLLLGAGCTGAFTATDSSTCGAARLGFPRRRNWAVWPVIGTGVEPTVGV